jgi:transcription elongation factor GreA
LQSTQETVCFRLGGKHPFQELKVTQEIKQKLQAELDELESELRIHLPKEIKRALEFGDLRENAEYRAALDRQNVVKARIVELRQRISEIGSIDLSKVPRDRAGYGSTLVLYDAERDEELTYRLVTPEESDPQGGMISMMSPVGKSLLGKQEGDEVTVRTPAGARNFEIKRLTTIHDETKG